MAATEARQSPVLPLKSEAMGGSALGQHGNENEEVEVRLRHRASGSELTVSVPSCATMRDVLRAASERAGDESILTAGRLVKPVPGPLGQVMSYESSEALGSKRRLMYVGPPLPSMPQLNPATPVAVHEEAAALSLAAAADSSKSRPSAADGTSVAAAVASPTAIGKASRAAAAPTPAVSAAAQQMQPRLTQRRAISFLTELHTLFLDSKFQKQLKELKSVHAVDTSSFAEECANLVTAVLKEVLPKYMFEADAQGAADLLRELEMHGAKNDAVKQGRAQLDSRLGVAIAQLTLFPAPKKDDQAKAVQVEEVEVRLRNNAGHAEFFVKVPANAMMWDVLAAAAAQTGDDAFLSSVRIVKPVPGGVATLYDDTDILGKRRRLLFAVLDGSPVGGLRQPEVQVGLIASASELIEVSVPVAVAVKDVLEAVAAKVGRPGVANGTVWALSDDGLAPLEPSVELGSRRSLLLDEAGTLKNPPRELLLSRQCALSIQKDLLQEFSDIGFQQQFSDLAAIFVPGSTDYAKERWALIRKMQTDVFARHGFQADEWGILNIVQQLACISALDPEAKTVGKTIDQLLAGPQDWTPKPKAPVASPKQAVDGGSLPRSPSALSTDASDDDSGAGCERREVTLSLQHSTKTVVVVLKGGKTVADLKQRLCEEFGLPSTVTLLSQMADSDWLPLQDLSAPAPNSVQVRGAGLLTNDSSIHWRGIVKDEMLRAVQEMNAQYSRPIFQERLTNYRNAPLAEAMLMMRMLREEINVIVARVIVPLGFEASMAGFKDWEKAVAEFSRFPTFAEACRKSKVLVGMLTPHQAWKMQRESWGPDLVARNDVHSLTTTHCQETLSVTAIPSEFALTENRSEANEILDLLHRRIYEENRMRLWKGGREMPSRDTMARKYLEAPGAILLHCQRTGAIGPDALVGGAVICPRKITLPAAGAGASPQDSPKGAESVGGPTKGEDVAEGPIWAVYIDGIASAPSTGAGSAMLEHVRALADIKGWDILALHSIHAKGAMGFWNRQGFHKVGPNMEPAHFAFLCLQSVGRSMSREIIERQLPSRPGCTLFVKFHQRQR